MKTRVPPLATPFLLSEEVCALLRIGKPSRLSVSINRVEVNCVPLSVVIVKRASRLAAGRLRQ